MHQDHPQNNAIMSLDILLMRLLAVMIQKTIWMLIGARLLSALTIAVRVRLSMIGDHLLMTVNPVVCLVMTVVGLIESLLMIVRRDQFLVQFTVPKIVLLDLRFHPMTVAVQLMTELLASFLSMPVHPHLRMLNVLDLLKREYLSNQPLLSKTVSVSRGLPEWRVVLTINQVWRSAFQMHLLPVLIDLFWMTVLLVLALSNHRVYYL